MSMSTVPSASTDLQAFRGAARERLARLEGYLRQDPTNETLVADAVMEAIRCEEWDRADFYLKHGQSLQPASISWSLRQVDFHLARQQYERARLLLQQLAATETVEGEVADIVLHNLAFIDVQEGQLQTAIARMAPRLEGFATALDSRTRSSGSEDALNAMPDTTLQILWLRALHHEGALERALLWAQQLGRAQALLPPVAGVASLIALDEGELAHAQQWSMASLEAPGSKRSMEALVTQASLALAAQDLARSRQWADAALQVNPRDGRALSVRGFVALLGQQAQEARAWFEQALLEMDRHIGTWHGLAWAQLLEQDLAGAERSFEHALLLDRNFAESHGGLAIVSALRRDVGAAQGHIERAVRLDPGNLSGRYAQAVLNGELTDAKAFQRMAKRLLGSRADPMGATLYESLSRTWASPADAGKAVPPKSRGKG